MPSEKIVVMLTTSYNIFHSSAERKNRYACHAGYHHVGWPAGFFEILMDHWTQAILTVLARCTARRDLKRRSGTSQRSLKVWPKVNASLNEDIHGKSWGYNQNMGDMSVCSKVGGGCPVTLIYGKFDRKLVNRGVLE